jgi:hypothetical protein
LNFGHFYVGQDGILRPIGNRPAAWEGLPYGLITNRPQIDNLMPFVFSDTVILHLLWGGQSWSQAGLPAGWTRWKASPY